MKIKKTQLVASILIFVIALGMIGTGVYGLSGRQMQVPLKRSTRCVPTR